MDFYEKKEKYNTYLGTNVTSSNEKYSKVMSSPRSTYLSNLNLPKLLKENLAELEMKKNKMIPATVGEILAMQREEEEEEEYDTSEISKTKNDTTSETTYNKDLSKNNIKKKYDKNGKIKQQEVTVTDKKGAVKSKYITEYNSSNKVTSEVQIEYGANSNGSSDMAIGYSTQGKKGDCWLLSTLNSLGSTKAGQQIIANSITKNSDGSYSIEFKGVNTKIKITQEELNAAKQSGDYANGDDDVILFELGFESVINKIQRGEIKINGNHPGLSIKEGDNTQALAGGNLEDAIFLLTGQDVSSEFKNFGASTENFDKILSSLKDNPGKYAAIIGLSGGNDGLTLKDINGKEICTLQAGAGHAFSIKSVDEEGVTIVNPWDSSKEYKISLADARKYATGIQYFELDDSFKETDTFDSSVLDKEPVQSNESATTTNNNDTNTNEQKNTSKSTDTKKTDNGNNSVNTGNQNNTNSKSRVNSSGGSVNHTNTNTNTNSTVEIKNTTVKDYKNMSIKELSNAKSTQESELDKNKEEYNKILNGENDTLSALKEDADKKYEKFQTELKKENVDLAQKYNDSKLDVEAKQLDLDKTDEDIFNKSNELTASDAKINSTKTSVGKIQDGVDDINAVISSAEGEDKNEYKGILKEGLQALKETKDAHKAAIKEQQRREEDFEELKAIRQQKEQALKESKTASEKIENQITELTKTDENSPLSNAYKEYKEAESKYEKAKAKAISDVQTAISKNETEIKKIDEQIEIKSTKEKSDKFSLKNDVFAENVNYTSEVIKDSSGMKYIVMKPNDVSDDEELPMLMYLHGLNENGSGQKNLMNQCANQFNEDFRGYIVLPMLNKAYWGDRTCNVESELRSIINNFTSTHKVDKDNIALAGYSLGGIGAIYMAKHMGDVFSRASIISGQAAGDKNGKIEISSIDIPINGYVGTNGDGWSAKYMTKEIENLTQFEGVGHGGIQAATLSKDTDKNGRSDFFEWLFPSNKM